MKKHEKYVECGNLRNATHLEVSVYYSKGGISYFTGQTSPRGYYLSVTPVKKGSNMVSYEMFSGFKQLLLETKRYSDKQFGQAIEMSKGVEQELIAAVIDKHKAA